MIPKQFPAAMPQARLFKKIITAFIFLFLTQQNRAQKISITGIISDEKGAPVSWGSVSAAGTGISTTSDLSGKFFLKEITLPVTIRSVAVGYETVEKTIDKKSSRDSVIVVNIILKRLVEELSEVVVTAYGLTRDSREMGYSTASVSATPVRSRKDAAALRGKVAGISAAHAAAAPASSALNKKMVTHDSITNITHAKQSGLLTAGELNDFKKWKMWSDYTQNEFKDYSGKWQLNATKRYCVQLQNAAKKAITGETVYLLNDETGDTLWRAVSDNTGKAELWQGFNDDAEGGHLSIAVSKEVKQYNAIEFSQGINNITVNKSCAVSDKVEIAFVVDATGSMQDEINYLKDELADVLTNFMAGDAGVNLRTGAVFYRDHGDEYVTRLQDLSKGIDQTVGFIKKQEAGGGGDYPEAVNEALGAAIQKLHWSPDARTRIIFLFMDAPPHDETKSQIAALSIQAAAKGIRIIPVACSGTDKATEFIMRSMALATNGNYLFLTDDSGIGDPHIKPTTDEIKVELLNNLLLRIMKQMCYVNSCEENTAAPQPLGAYNNLENVSVFPNPTPGLVTLQTTIKIKEIFVADFTGKLLIKIPLGKKQNTQVDLSGFPAGTYFIKYVTDKNTMGAEKVVLIR